MPLITPPFRTSLLTQNGVPFGSDSDSVQTTKDWWLYWNQLTDRSNSNSKLATAGTHADRPMPANMPEGALYYENDRGVLYAGTRGVWQYVAGTMFGTLSPDQRPTDLGTHDAGFAFRTIDTDPGREFLWSQTAWVETTPVLLTNYAASTADLTLTGSIQDVPGATVTVTRNGRYYAVGTAWFKQTSVNPGVTGICIINAGGTNLGPSIGFVTGNAAANSTGGCTASQTATFTISSAPQTVKLVAFQNNASPALVVGNSWTTLLVVWVGP